MTSRIRRTSMLARSALWLVSTLALSAGCSAANAEPEPRAEKETRAPSRKPPDAEATRVEVAVVDPSTAELHVSIPGEIEGARDALLAASQGGHVEAVHVEEGDRVRKGQTLARVDTSIYRAQVARSLAELDQAKKDQRRMQALGDAVTGVERETAETKLQVATASHELAKARFSRSIIRAPFSGVVARVAVEVGEAATAGGPVARLVQLDPVLVTLSVPDRDVVALNEGETVEVRTNARAGVFEGVIKRIGTAADLETRAFTAEIEVENADRELLPGMIASVNVAKNVSEDAVVIPQDWLVTKRDGVGVFLVENDVAHWQPVEPGQVVRNQVVIREGISVGDRLVITGHRGLADGDALLVAREGRCCEQGRVTF